jgi:hypothetical protein
MSYSRSTAARQPLCLEDDSYHLVTEETCRT